MKRLSSAAANVVISNDDLLRLILLRLPPKSLVRFKSVSKKWRSIISEDREFAIEHSRRNSDSNAASGIYLYDTSDPDPMSISIFGGSVPSLSFLNQIQEDVAFNNIVSCNGLLFCSFSEYCEPSYAQVHCVVCNPTTRDFKLLPQLPFVLPAEDDEDEDEDGIYNVYSGFALIFDPSESHHYKVAVIKSFCDFDGFAMHDAGPKYELHIYSSESNSWEFKCHLDVHMDSVSRGVYLNDDDNIYWIVDREYMMSYDINSEDFGYIDIPEELFSKSQVFTQSQGQLCLAASSSKPGSNEVRCQIFEFDNSSLQWSDHPVEGLDTISDKHFDLVGLVRGENETYFLVLHLNNTTLIIFDTVLHREVVEVPSKIYSHHVCEYIPSLAPV